MSRPEAAAVVVDTFDLSAPNMYRRTVRAKRLVESLPLGTELYAKAPPGLPDAVRLAYGLLWMATSTDKRVQAARRQLLSVMTKQEQAAGIEAARNFNVLGETSS